MPIHIIRRDAVNDYSFASRAGLAAAGPAIHVDNLNGSDSSGNGTSGNPYKTILKGFQNWVGQSDSPVWIVTNPAYRVNASTGNDGTGGRFGGSFQSITAAQAHGSYTQGDAIYVEAGNYTLASTIGGADYYFNDGSLVSYSGNTITSSRVDRNYGIAGFMALTLTNVNAQAGTFDSNRESYVQYKSITCPSSYANHGFALVGNSANAKAYVWIDSDFAYTPASSNLRIAYVSNNHLGVFRMRGITNSGSSGNSFHTSASSNMTVYCDSYTHTGIGGISVNAVSNDGTGLFSWNCTGNMIMVGQAFSITSSGGILATVGGSITSSGEGGSMINNGGSGTITVIAGGTIQGANGTSYTIITQGSSTGTIDITAAYIFNANTSSRSPIFINSGSSTVKLRNADIRGQDTSGGLGAIRTMSGSTLEIYNCIIRSNVTNPQASIKESAAGSATVSYFGACQLSDAVHAGITEVNTGNRTINSSLRYT